MTSEIHNPELEVILQQRLKDGNFANVEEMLLETFASVPLPEKRNSTDASTASPSSGGSLHEFFMHSPLRGANLDLERTKDYPRTVEIE